MNFDDKMEIQQLKRDLEQIKKEFRDFAKQVNEEIATLQGFINQNSLQSSENSAQGLENEPRTQSGISAGLAGRPDFFNSSIWKFERFRQAQIDSQQNSPSNQRNDERNTDLVAMLLNAVSDADEIAPSSRENQQRNYPQSRSGKTLAESNILEAINNTRTRLDGKGLGQTERLAEADRLKDELIAKPENREIIQKQLNQRLKKTFDFYNIKKKVYTGKNLENLIKKAIISTNKQINTIQNYLKLEITLENQKLYKNFDKELNLNQNQNRGI